MKKYPKECNICRNKIGLYQPYYTILSESHSGILKHHKNLVVLCPGCFHAYERFMEERKQIRIYQKAKQI